MKIVCRLATRCQIRARPEALFEHRGIHHGPSVARCHVCSVRELPARLRSRDTADGLRELRCHLVRLQRILDRLAEELLRVVEPRFIPNCFELQANFWDTLRGPFSAVSRMIFATKCSLERS